MNDSFLKMFKFVVPSQKKVYRKVQDLPGYQDLTYRKYRKDNVELDILSNYIACMNSDKDLFENVQIKNLFKYLAKNIHGSKPNDVKKVLFRIYDLETLIVDKISVLDSMNKKTIVNNLNMVLGEITILKKILIDSTKGKNSNFEKEVQFEALAKQLLFPDNYDDTILSTLFYNSVTLNNSPNNSKKFSDMFYREILQANISNDYDRKKYYRLLGNYLMETNLLKLDRKVINALNLRKDSDNFNSCLEQKISKMEKDEKTGRYIVDDYIVTFDGSTTSRFDDALSIEQTPTGSYILGIHIADVFSLSLNPFNRSDYKEKIDEKSKASLKAYNEKNAISLFVEIGSNGLIIDKRFLMTRIEVNRNLLYDDFPKIINDHNNSNLSNTVINLAGLYRVIDNEKLPMFPSPKEMAHSIVHKYMLLYGCIASKIAKDNNYPILYFGPDRHLSVNPLSYDSGFVFFDTYSRATSPIWDLESEANQFSLCECVFNKITQREKNNMKMSLLMTGNFINENK